MHLVVGLGNPGRKYEKTRHNAGFLVADCLARRSSTSCAAKQFKALVAKPLIAGRPAILAKPQTWMNLSGHCVVSLQGYYDVDPEHLMVVHDEVDLPFGEVRIKVGGGHGGHNGLRDLKKHVRGDFVRVRFGVSRPPEGWDTADYVLSKWTSEESAELDLLVERAADAVEAVVRDGALAAMNEFNVRTRSGSARGAEPGPGPAARAASGPLGTLGALAP